MPFFRTEDNVKLYYEEHGSGRPIVFIHGLTANHSHFRRQVSGLVDRFHILVYDQRGHGDSDMSDFGLNITRLAHDLRELMIARGLANPVLVGWSMGAHVIFDYIRCFGDNDLAGICIIDMSPRILNTASDAAQSPWHLGLRGPDGKVGSFGDPENTRMLAYLAECDPETFARNLVERLYARGAFKGGDFITTTEIKGQRDFQWLYAQALRNRSPALVSFWASMALKDYRKLLPDIAVPALITYGVESNYYPPETAQYMADQFRNAKLAAFSGCGHALHLQDSQKFNQALSAFVIEQC